MQSKAKSVEEYLGDLPTDRRESISLVRSVLLKSLPKGYEEGMQYGMIGYYVPHSIYPSGYHCDSRQPLPFISLASQKNYMSLYMFCIYGDPAEQERFQKAWSATGKKLDAGKSCVRFKKVDDLALDVIADAIRRMPVEKFIKTYEANIKGASRSSTSRSAKKKKKKTAKKAATKSMPKKKAKTSVASKKAAVKKRKTSVKKSAKKKS